MDYDSEAEIWSRDADELLPPSSMIKLMTLAVVFDAIKDGSLKLGDKLSVSENADHKNPIWTQASKVCLVAGQDISVRDAILGVIVVSGGDASVVLAERLAGTEGDFTIMMQRKARALGMDKSSFANVSGLPARDNLMTARELGVLAENMIRDYPDMYPMFATRRFEYNDFKDGWCKTWGDLHRVNYNKLLFMMGGADGMKTGHTDTGGFGMVASAKRGTRRLIGIVNGLRVKNHDALASEMKRMLEWGFANTTTRVFFKEGQVVAKIPVWYGRQKVVEAAPQRPVAATIFNGGSISDVQVIARYNDPVSAPVKKGDRVGDVLVKQGGKVVATIPLVAKKDVNKAQFFGRMFMNIGIILGQK
jgi:D-alanyl-D-alanine carboxypeptidase (penicillin-binding protein 5/6)